MRAKQEKSMFTPRINRPIFRLLVLFLIAAGLAIGAAPAWATDISWRGTSKRTSNEGSHYTREGTAVFTTGEEAHFAVNGTLGPNSNPANGTATVEIIYRFKDDSGFTLRGVGIWNESLQANAGIFVDGVGRFAGMTGSATCTGDSPAKGATETVWNGTYELSPK
jgi:hypothetical protein